MKSSCRVTSLQRKCNDYFMEHVSNLEKQYLSYHDMSAVKNTCNKAVLIEHGLVKVVGSQMKLLTNIVLIMLLVKRFQTTMLLLKILKSLIYK